MLEAFPPRGVINLLESKHTEGERPLMDRLVVEDYLLDTMAYYDADRLDCAMRMACEGAWAHARVWVRVCLCGGSHHMV
jgi:hypothetical protein